MNTHERTISDALRAYGEGLEMTTQDVERLEQQLDHTRETRRQDRRGRIRQAAVAACAVTGVVLGGLTLRNDLEAPQPATPAPITLEDLHGIWREDSADASGWLWHFFDQRVTRTDRPGDLFGSTGQAVTLSPGGFTIDDVDPGCSTGFTASISDEGRMTVTLTSAEPLPDGSCEPLDGEVWSFTRVSPVSVAGAVATSLLPGEDPTPVTQLYELTGTWLLRGTGRALAITALGSYETQDLGESPQPETGKVEVGEDGRVTFVPTDAAACPVSYDVVTTRTNALDAKLGASSCGRFGAFTDTWIRLN